jgi:hypothetical protein
VRWQSLVPWTFGDICSVVTTLGPGAAAGEKERGLEFLLVFALSWRDGEEMVILSPCCWKNGFGRWIRKACSAFSSCLTTGVLYLYMDQAQVVPFFCVTFN